MKKHFYGWLVLIFVFAVNSFAQGTVKSVRGFDANYKIAFRNAVEDKNFYLLSLFQHQHTMRRDLRKYKILQTLAEKEKNALKNATSCEDVACYDQAFRLSDGDIEAVAKAFENAANDAKLKRLAEKDLRPSGMFIRYVSKSDAALLAAAWRDAAKGLNHILDVYGLGKDALYKDIDNASYDVNGAEYKRILKSKVAEINLPKDALFFEPTLAYALKLLEANGRDEAGRYEAYEKTVNRKAFENLKNIRWDDYPYSVILVLGSGPGKTGLSISNIGMERSDEAVKLFQAKKAPLIIFSGGYVHPARTSFCEAIEMKKYVMQKYGIAEENILVEPMARHTTTNVRNAARIMFRDKIPTDKKGLITSSQSHIDSVVGAAFAKRNMTELGFVPMQIFQRISPVAVEFTPSLDSLFANSMEPLDP